MDFKQLRYFVCIADVGSMTRAAESLHIAQPALTQQMANLESELESRVFDRSSSGVRLTSAGEVLYRHAKSLLRQLEDAREATRNEELQPSGRVCIGTPGSTGKILSVPLIRHAAQNEKILLEVVERPSAELLALVAKGHLDIAVVVDAKPSRGVSIRPLVTEELYAMVPVEEARGRTSVGLRDLSNRPLVLPGEANTIRQRVDLAFAKARMSYRLLGEVTATDMLIRLVASGLGWTILPWSALGDGANASGVQALRIRGQSLSRELSLCVADSVPLSRAAEVAQGWMLEIFAQLVESGEWYGVRPVENLA